MSKHWALYYVRVIWTEDVADGYVTSFRSSFIPDQPCTRAQYAMMLAKVFRLKPLQDASQTFRDVTRDYYAYPKKRAYDYIEAAALEGFVVGFPGGWFRPNWGISRQDTVLALVRSLGLSAYAASLTPKEVERLLNRYKDWPAIYSEARPSVAAATRLGIIEGYPDGTFKPTRELTRAEAATVIYRSCLIRAEARPALFYPDGDGFDDWTEVFLYTLKNSNLSAWSLAFTDAGGAQVARFGLGSFLGRPRDRIPAPVSVIWAGVNTEGRSLSPGTYFYQARVRDTAGLIHYSVLKPVSIGIRSLSASLSPQRVNPGDRITVSAETSGYAIGVALTLPGGTITEMDPVLPIPSYTNSWTASFAVRPGQPAGLYQVAVTAAFQGPEKSVIIGYEVVRTGGLPGDFDPEEALSNVVFVLVD
jgi:hypothetical protein